MAYSIRLGELYLSHDGLIMFDRIVNETEKAIKYSGKKFIMKTFEIWVPKSVIENIDKENKIVLTESFESRFREELKKMGICINIVE